MIKYNYKKKAHIKTLDTYQSNYNFSIRNNDTFWETQAKSINWIKKWNKVSDVDYLKADEVSLNSFKGLGPKSIDNIRTQIKEHLSKI